MGPLHTTAPKILETLAKFAALQRLPADSCDPSHASPEWPCASGFATVLYAISRIVWTIVQPSSLLLLLCIAGTSLSLWRPRSNWGRRLLIGGVGSFAVCAFLPVGAWLLRPLEDRFPPLRQIPANVDGIIVLGGAISLGESTAHEIPALNERAERMTAFVALARRYPRARLVFTGGNPEVFPVGPTEADLARNLFTGLGLDLRRILFEDRSRNTHENAVFLQRLVNPRPGENWLLVTSAADMPRAIGCFWTVGWPVVAFPVDYHARSRAGAVPGLVAGLRDVDWAAHEWIGLAYYWSRGWILSLFPHVLTIRAGNAEAKTGRTE
jgi:uncharacterized SAM-binding protein YcdF (DUF218 family)